MYIRTKKVWEEIKRRNSEKKKIKKKINRLVEEKYGIVEFTELERRYFEAPAAPAGVLARQVPSATVEDVVCFCGAKKLGLKPLAFSFLEDGFYSCSPYKISLVKPFIIKWLSERYTVERLALLDRTPPERMILKNIIVNGGGTLPEFHRQLRERVFNSHPSTTDISDFFRECLIRAEKNKRPPFVFEEQKDGREKKKKTEEADLLKSRPPASWYYPLYLTLFLGGERVLLETYNNPRGGVPEIRKKFEIVMKDIKTAIGYYPMVVEIPPLTKELSYINFDILLRGVGAVDDKSISAEGDTVEMFKKIAEKVINFKGI